MHFRGSRNWSPVTAIWSRETKIGRVSSCWRRHTLRLHQIDSELPALSFGINSFLVISWCKISTHGPIEIVLVQSDAFSDVSKLASSYGYMKQWNLIQPYLELLTSPHAQTSPDRLRITCSFIWEQLIFGDSGCKITIFLLTNIVKKGGTKKVSFWSTFSRFWTTFSTTRSHFKVSYIFSWGRPASF